jgi:hypothetical protein
VGWLGGALLATQVFTDEELEGLRRFPEIGREELFRFFTLTPADAVFVDPGRGRGAADRLGLAVQLVTVRYLGTFLSNPTEVPVEVIDYLAEQLAIEDASCIKKYAQREPTHREHAGEIQRATG